MSNEKIVEQIKNGVSVTENMQLLYENNLPLIKRSIMRYSCYESIEDLLQEAYFGLWEAVRHYEPSENVRFMTYAVYWIKQTVIQYIEKCGYIIRIPRDKRNKILHYKKAVEMLYQKNGRIPTDTEIAEKIAVDISEINDLRKYSFNVCSLDETLGSDSNETIGCRLKDNVNIENDIVETLYNEYTENELWEIVKLYTSTREFEVLVSRFKEKKSYEEIEGNSDIKSSSARSIEHAALRKLRVGKARRELIEKFDILEAGLYRNGLNKFKQHGYSSMIEYIVFKRIELNEEIEKRKCL